MVDKEHIENSLEEVVGEGEGVGRRKLVVAVEGWRALLGSCSRAAGDRRWVRVRIF